MIKNSTRTSGFTLLELLVVISIIGILIAISVPAFATAQRQSRNARRLGDLKAVQNCLEQFYVANSSSYAGGSSCVTTTDPKPSGTAYRFITAPSATEYKFCVYKENIGSGAQPAYDADETTVLDKVCATQLQ